MKAILCVALGLLTGCAASSSKNDAHDAAIRNEIIASLEGYQVAARSTDHARRARPGTRTLSLPWAMGARGKSAPCTAGPFFRQVRCCGYATNQKRARFRDIYGRNTL